MSQAMQLTRGPILKHRLPQQQKMVFVSPRLPNGKPRVCDGCGETFLTGKSWGGHIKSCYKKHRLTPEPVQSDYDNKLQQQQRYKKPCVAAESKTISRPLPPPAVESICSAAASSTTTSTDECSSDEYYNQDLYYSVHSSGRATNLVDGVSGGSTPTRMRGTRKSAQLELEGTKEVTLGSNSVINRNRSQSSEDESPEAKLPQQENNLDLPLDLGLGTTVMMNEKSSSCQASKKYVCTECGIEFSTFQPLGGHMAGHNRKRRRDEAVVSASSQAAGGSTAEVGEIKEYQCDLCDKKFTTGQALGGHKTAHRKGKEESNGLGFDLNADPGEGRWTDH